MIQSATRYVVEHCHLHVFQQKVRDLLFKSLRPRRMDEEREPALVASLIETECFNCLKDKEYYSQVRNIKFNLTDPKNPNFKSKVFPIAHVISTTDYP